MYDAMRFMICMYDTISSQQGEGVEEKSEIGGKGGAAAGRYIMGIPFPP